MRFYDERDLFGNYQSSGDKRFGLDHFDTKLVMFVETMHTTVAREMALARTKVMPDYSTNFVPKFNTIELS
ncbi:hypothetical protein AAC03nite_00850 [Alicyclobacillus acidoterrestris]|uniref:hypothetical protein n=1 Tax=Alicyclobacillus suci TaxID=2816080 RepID=UPI001195DBB3|nr:hypothetical protein [Alicyclobacillus suci]GEO24300.1 hypothetical protein AAC03nite_00850 [Alicyclobacillus acidoterrestris]